MNIGPLFTAGFIEGQKASAAENERLRAIIKTIREPTDEMLRAGNVRTFPDSYYAMVGMATDGYQQLLRTTVSEQTLIGKIAHQQEASVATKDEKPAK